MDKERVLKLFYAASLADAAYYYGKHWIITEVIEEKRESQIRNAESQLAQLGIGNLEQLYQKFYDIFGCASWSYREDDKGDSPEATTTSCMLCAIAKKQGAAKPCEPFCINPFTAFAESLGHTLEVKSTLWDGAECRFSHEVK
jgi:hypothetical protein